jgi:hypothetical protein
MKPAKQVSGKSRSKKTVTTVTSIPSLSLDEKIPTYHFSIPTSKNTTVMIIFNSLTIPKQVESNTELVQTPFFNEDKTTVDDLSLFQLRGTTETEDAKEKLSAHYQAIETDLQSQMEAQEEDKLIVACVEIYSGSMDRREIFETLAKHFTQRKGDSENISTDEMIAQLEKRYDEIVRRNSRKSPVARTPNQFSVQDAWKSFDSLFCIKCKVYDCQQHAAERKLRPVPNEEQRRRDVAIVNRDRVHALLGKMLDLTIIQTMVCDSPECYKSHANPQSTDIPAQDPNVNWNDDETVLLLRSIQVLGEELQQTVSVVDPFCALAALAVISCATPKTCKQVRDHLVRWHKGYIPTTEGTKEGEQLPTKAEQEPAALPSTASTNLPRAYTPCKCSSNASSSVHEAACSDSTCSCLASMNYCTKWCCDGQCSNSVPGIPHNNCKNFFAGCTCTAMTCQSQTCPCYIAGRECDPNMCTTCDSLHTCHNRFMQRGLFKNIALARVISTCAENENDEDTLPKNRYGTLLLEKAAAGELITEFVGELISDQDLQRRSKYWNQQERDESLVCDLTTEYILDSHRVSNNKIKFIRTSSDSAVANVELRNVYVCGDYRLGVFAKRDLATCNELILDISVESGRYVRKIEESRTVEKRGVKRQAEDEEISEAPSKRKKFAPKRLSVKAPAMVEMVATNPEEENVAEPVAPRPDDHDLMQE